MIAFLKRLFAAPPPQPPTPFSVRVVPFDRDVSYYAIEYRPAGSAVWHRHHRAFTSSSCIDLWDPHHPCLYPNHDAAVADAKQLTPESIAAHNAAQAELYATKLAEAKAALKARQITTYVR